MTEVEQLRRLVMAMANRVAEQSDSLSTIAARGRRSDDPRPLLVGEASNLESGEAFRGRSGERVAALLGVSLDRMHELVECVNLVPWWPGRSEGEKGHLFPREVARLRAKCLNVVGRRVVLAGKRVAAAFGLGNVDWLAPVDLGRGEASAVVMPHPSGIVRFWNDPANVRRASRLLRRLVREST